MADNDNESVCRLLTQIENSQKLPEYYCEKLIGEINEARIVDDADASLVIKALFGLEPDIGRWGRSHVLGGRLAGCGWSSSLGLMLDGGLDPNATDRGDTVVHRSLLMQAACNFKAVKTMQMLLDRGADIEQIDKNGETAIFWAGFMSNHQGLRLLLDMGANVLHVDNDGKTPLFNCFVSVEEANQEDVLSCARQLLDAGVDPCLQDTAGDVVVQYADSYGADLADGFRALLAEHSARGLTLGTCIVGAKGSLPRM